MSTSHRVSAQMVNSAKWRESLLINLTTGYEPGRSLSEVYQEMVPAFRALIAAKQQAPTRLSGRSAGTARTPDSAGGAPLPA